MGKDYDWGFIYLNEAPVSSVLGCEVGGDYGDNVCSGSQPLSVDIYGHFNAVYRTHNYMNAYPTLTKQSNSYLLDVSYYYSSVPDFITKSNYYYTWPDRLGRAHRFWGESSGRAVLLPHERGRLFKDDQDDAAAVDV